MTEFIKNAIKTECPITPEVLKRMEECGPFLARYFDVVHPIVTVLDRVKKYVFYGKDEITDTALFKDYSVLGERFRGVKQDGHTARIFHGVLGVITESVEMMPIMNDIVRRSSYDKTNLLEECFDGQWYHAVICDELNYTFAQGQTTNTSKLRERFPDKFSEDDANTRNLINERKVLEDGNVNNGTTEGDSGSSDEREGSNI